MDDLLVNLYDENGDHHGVWEMGFSIYYPHCPIPEIRTIYRTSFIHGLRHGPHTEKRNDVIFAKGSFRYDKQHGPWLTT
jgi:hypothetical protein